MENSKIGIEGNGEFIESISVTNHNVTREEFDLLYHQVQDALSRLTKVELIYNPARLRLVSEVNEDEV